MSHSLTNPVGIEMIFEYKISGIPCKIRVDSVRHVKGLYSYNAPSDLDYYGYTEIEYTVLDRRGYPAQWLARKVNDTLDDEIKRYIANNQ